MELALTGENLSAERAHELGLVNVLAEPGSALEAAIGLAERITANGPLAVAATKRIITESRGWSPEHDVHRADQDPDAGVQQQRRQGGRGGLRRKASHRNGPAPDTGGMTPSADASECEQAAIRAFLLGADDECVTQWEAAQRAALAAGQPAEAARYAFWLGFLLLARGQSSRANGWLARSESLIAQAGVECRASGYLLIPQGLAALEAGDPGRARELSARAADIGHRFDDADLRTFGTLCQGQALIALGEPDAGVAKLDEVMVAVTTGELSPIATGIAYCAVILECVDLFDLRRAAEWTEALSGWCDAQPGLVPFRGQCLVHRSQLQAGGGRLAGGRRKRTERVRCGLPIPRIRRSASRTINKANCTGCVGICERRALLPGSGPARSRPGAGTGAARAGQGTGCDRGRDDPPGAGGAPASGSRAALLFAAVEIYRATGDLAAAREVADELSAIAARSSSEHPRGDGRPGRRDGAARRREMWRPPCPSCGPRRRSWRAAHMPYEVARTAVLLGLACAALGDSDRCRGGVRLRQRRFSPARRRAGPGAGQRLAAGFGATDVGASAVRA